MGVAGCGKTSIKKVVFEKLSPYESVFNTPTSKIETFTNVQMGFENIIVTEYPGSFSGENASADELKCFENCGMIVYVYDVQDTKNDCLEYFKKTVIPQLNKYPEMELAIFIHKVDSVNSSQGDFSKQKGEINKRFKDALTDAGSKANPNFYITSIYDYSLFETFSKIFQKMIYQNSQLSALLDELAMKSKFERAYLFDVFSKVYLAVDNFPLDPTCFELCSDMIDVVLDMSGIYGEENNNESYFDDNSTSLIRINNPESVDNPNSVLYLRFIDSNFALICMINESSFEKPHILDYNIKLFRDAVKQIGIKDN